MYTYYWSVFLTNRCTSLQSEASILLLVARLLFKVIILLLFRTLLSVIYYFGDLKEIDDLNMAWLPASTEAKWFPKSKVSVSSTLASSQPTNLTSIHLLLSHGRHMHLTTPAHGYAKGILLELNSMDDNICCIPTCAAGVCTLTHALGGRWRAAALLSQEYRLRFGWQTGPRSASSLRTEQDLAKQCAGNMFPL